MNVIQINELTKLTEKNWGSLSPEIYPDSKLDFTVIAVNGPIVYSTAGLQDISYEELINEAVKNRQVLTDIIVDGELVGKLMVHENLTAAMNRAGNDLKRSFYVLFSALILIFIAYYIYLDRRVFRPFHTLKQFASGIATGNLDTPIRMDKSNSFGAFTESFDLMRDALLTARQNEYLANKSKKELVASLSHDIKNPVASIKAICETLALDSDNRRILLIHQKAEQIDTLISDMFQATLAELGELKVTAEEYSSEILLAMFEGANYYNKLELQGEIPDCLILCDKLRLNQIIDNLLGNSYKYAGTQIRISFVRSSEYLRITIKDYGKGIAEEELPLIWGKYYRGRNAEGKAGAGLGLYLSKMFIEKMGGQIDCRNESDGFAVLLDLKLAGKFE
jgi:signal transduction histidine kinase